MLLKQGPLIFEYEQLPFYISRSLLLSPALLVFVAAVTKPQEHPLFVAGQKEKTVPGRLHTGEHGVQRVGGCLPLRTADS